MNKYQTRMASKKLTAKKKMAPSPEKLVLIASKKALKLIARQAYLERKAGLKELKNQSVSRIVAIGKGRKVGARGQPIYASARAFDRQRTLDRQTLRSSTDQYKS